tara:strand:- start:64 stop:822 length:759 start_codon:yes stop_codon:yes gene_type:complete
MDYLKYGNRVQQQSQEFDQQKIQPEGFVDIKQKTNEVGSEFNKEKKSDLINLFSIPLGIYPYPHNFVEELKWIQNLECPEHKKYLGFTFNRQSEDTFILDNSELKNIRTHIEASLHHFMHEILMFQDDLVITQSWLNKNPKGESHHEHSHPNSFISGVWYPQVNKETPPIQFTKALTSQIELAPKNYNNYNCTTFLMPVDQGSLILFPSSLRHSVPPNQSDTERISLSFNTWPKGNFGDQKSLTLLPVDRCV